MRTKLIGWGEAEYKAWSETHKEAAKTSDLRNRTPEEVRLNFDSGPKIAGYASVFNTFYELWPGFQERVAPGAFAKSIQQDEVKALFNHDPNLILGSKTAGTLSLREDEHGLFYEIIPPDTSAGRDAVVSIKRKDVSQSSFGFNIVEQSLKYDKEQDLVSRTLTEVKLWDVSPVTFPASPSTEVSVRMTGRTSNEPEEIVGSETESPIHPVLSDEDLFKQFDRLKETAF